MTLYRLRTPSQLSAWLGLLSVFALLSLLGGMLLLYAYENGNPRFAVGRLSAAFGWSVLVYPVVVGLILKWRVHRMARHGPLAMSDVRKTAFRVSILVFVVAVILTITSIVMADIDNGSSASARMAELYAVSTLVLGGFILMITLGVVLVAVEVFALVALEPCDHPANADTFQDPG
ncbi:MAG: hypothetical protein WBG08_02260 [Litorimonas sp.]